MNPIIIGAGPIGSNTARLIKKLNPIIIESRKEVGIPVQCTGLVSTRLQKITKYPNGLILNKVKGAKLFSNNQEVVLKPNKIMAHVIDRAKFDKYMHSRCNVTTKFNEKFTNFKNNIVYTTKNKYKTDLVIDCSGPKKETKNILGVQAVTKFKTDTDLVELHFDDCPGFFAWVVPTGDGYCRVGLASNNHPMQMLKKFLKKIKAGKVKEYNAGLIPMSINNFVKDNYIQCGDAAGHVKALSGGGLVTGILSSEIMSRAIIKAYNSNNFSKHFFQKHYLNPWKKEIGKELWIHSKVRSFLNKTNYDELINFVKRNKDLFEKKADMDFLSNLLFRLIRPSNLTFIAKSLIKMVF